MTERQMGKTAAERAAARKAGWAKPVEPEQDAIILSCKLKSGAFESHIEVPLYATREQMDDFAARWLSMMDAGIKIGLSRPEKET